MNPLTNPNVRIGMFAIFYDPAALPMPVPLIPQQWSRVAINLAFGVVVIGPTADVGGFSLIMNIQGVEIEGTLLEDCLAWDVVGAALVTIPAGTVIRLPNGPAPVEQVTPFPGPEISFGG